jgi:hypothetical protein
MAGQAAALDQIAPVTSLAIDDTLLVPAQDEGSVPDADASYLSDPSPAIDLDDLADRLFAFSSAPGIGWRSFAEGILDSQHGLDGVPSIGVETAGIAIVGATLDPGVLGHWEYRNGLSATWEALDLSEAHETAGFPATSLAVLLKLHVSEEHKQIRFVPDADSLSGYASLTFRVWDGSDPGTSTVNGDPFAPQTFGGSPTAFSAETRTLKIHVQEVNDAPELHDEASSPSLVAIIPKTVGNLLATTSPFWDPDGTGDLGIAITEYDAVDPGWEYSLDGGSNWSVLADAQPGGESGEAFVLAPNAQLRYVGGVAGGSGLLTVHAWDRNGGQNSGQTISVDDSISAASVTIVVEANDPPLIDAVSGLVDGKLHVQRGTTTEFTIAFRDDDADPEAVTNDEVLAWSAAAVSYDRGSIDGGTLTGPFETGGAVTVTCSYTPGADDSAIEIEMRDLAGVLEGYGGMPAHPDHIVTQTIEVVLGNTAPDISFDAEQSRTVRVGGPNLNLDLSSFDLNGDGLAWSVLRYSGDTTGALSLYSPNSVSGGGNRLTYVPDPALTAIATETVTATADDGFGGVTSVSVTITVEPTNRLPTVGTTAPGTPPTVTLRLDDEPVEIALTSADADDDLLTWTASSSAYGDLVLASPTGGAGAGNTATFTPSAETAGETVRFTVDDGHGGTSFVDVVIVVQAPANVAPSFSRPISHGEFAIVGQPFEAVVRATDSDSDDLPLLSLTAVEYGGRPVSIARLDDGLWRVTWTPTAEGFGQLDLTVTDPHLATDTDGFSLSYVAAPTPVTLPASLPTSSAGAIVYGAIAPGSASAFTVLDGFLNSQPRSVARAFWWTGGAYAELPGSTVSDPLRAGVFLASTVPANLTFAPPTQPAPFAITLRAGQWTFFGIPPLLLSSDGGSETTHPWDEIELQTLDGQGVDLATKLAAIGPDVGGDSDADTQPWQYRWDLTPATYQRTASLASGTGYWLRNRSGVDYRLVRLPAQYMGGEAARPGMAGRSARPVSAADLPPAPPAGPTAAAASADGGGSCGSGGLAGLLLAGLALLGLRPRRRN